MPGRFPGDTPGSPALSARAPITSQIRGIPTEVLVDAGPETGLKMDSVISSDNIRTVPKSSLVRQIGVLPASCEPRLTAAIVKAFDLMTDHT